MTVAVLAVALWHISPLNLRIYAMWERLLKGDVTIQNKCTAHCKNWWERLCYHGNLLRNVPDITWWKVISCSLYCFIIFSAVIVYGKFTSYVICSVLLSENSSMRLLLFGLTSHFKHVTLQRRRRLFAQLWSFTPTSGWRLSFGLTRARRETRANANRMSAWHFLFTQPQQTTSNEQVCERSGARSIYSRITCWSRQREAAPTFTRLPEQTDSSRRNTPLEIQLFGLSSRRRGSLMALHLLSSDLSNYYYFSSCELFAMISIGEFLAFFVFIKADFFYFFHHLPLTPAKSRGRGSNFRGESCVVCIGKKHSFYSC